MKQTVLEELIEKLKTLSPEAGKDSLVSQGYHEGIQWSIYFAQKFLVKEKEQIVDAFENGDNCIDDGYGGFNQKYKSAEDYFTQTFKQ